MLQVELDNELVEVSRHQLFALALRGRIGRQTKIVLDGKVSTAGKVKGIQFGGENDDESVSLNQDESAADNGIYGIASPPIPTVTAPNPFSATAPVVDNPFSVQAAPEGNPFTATPPKQDNPFTAVPPSSNPFTAIPSSTAPKPVSVPYVKPIPVPKPLPVGPPIEQATPPFQFKSKAKKGGKIGWILLIGVMVLLTVGGGWAVFTNCGQYTTAEAIQITKHYVMFGSHNQTLTSSSGVPRGHTMLHLEAGLGHAAIVKFLVSKGADPNLRTTDDGGTPLHWVLSNRDLSKEHIEIIRFLLSKGADIHAKKDSGTTPLDLAKENGNEAFLKNPFHAAAMKKDVEVVKYLVSRGANVNEKDELGKTPLHCLLEIHRLLGDELSKEQIEVVKYLISKGADVHEKDNYDMTPLDMAYHKRDKLAIIENPSFSLHAAIRSGDIQEVKRLSKKSNINVKSNIGLTPLMWAVLNGQMEIVEYLVSRGADVNAKNMDGESPLMIAISDGNIEIVKYLVSNGTDVNAKDERGDTSLHFAIVCYENVEIGIEIVKYLVSNGADVNEKNRRGESPLIHATWNNEIVKHLVSSGADVNTKDEDGRTPLMVAVCNIEVVKYLVSKGADINAKDKDGKTPLDAAKAVSWKDNTQMVQYLESIGGRTGGK